MVSMWVRFIVVVGLQLALDLGVFNKEEHAPTVREALAFTARTVALATALGGFIFAAYANHWGGLGSAVDAGDGVHHRGRLAHGKTLPVLQLGMGLVGE